MQMPSISTCPYEVFQAQILELRTQEHMANYKMDFDSAYAKALQTVAYPGTSEHHLGLAVDRTKPLCWCFPAEE